jgi:hypothetical protein
MATGKVAAQKVILSTIVTATTLPSSLTLDVFMTKTGEG